MPTWGKIWLAGCVPALALHALGSPAGVALRAATEAVLLLVAIALVAPRIASLFADVPRAARVALAFFASAQLFAQLAEINAFTYPFAQWGMYGYEPPRDVVVHVPVRVSESGAREEIRPSSEFPPLDSLRLSFRIEDLAGMNDGQCLDESLRALGRSAGAREVELVEHRFRASEWQESPGTVMRRVEVAP